MIGIKEFNKKIVSLKNTRKMTKTMKMVSASKFKRAYKAQSNAQAYAHHLTDLLSRLSGYAGQSHPLTQTVKYNNNCLVVVFTSDKGLCGGFNNNLVREIKRWQKDKPAMYNKLDFSFCGKRGFMALRRLVSVRHHYENITAKPNYADALKLAGDLTKSFLSNEYDEIYVAYNFFKSPLSQQPRIEKLFPLDLTFKSQSKVSADYTFEPSQSELFDFLVPKYLNFKLFYLLLENAAGEHGSRMTAMDKASSNTSDLIEKYTMLRNRARQAAITTELIEIISGAEALK